VGGGGLSASGSGVFAPTNAVSSPAGFTTEPAERFSSVLRSPGRRFCGVIRVTSRTDGSKGVAPTRQKLLEQGEVRGGGYPVVADWRRCGVILLTDADSVCVCVSAHTHCDDALAAGPAAAAAVARQPS